MPPRNRSCLPSAVKLLAARDYSEGELRARLARQGHAAADIDAAVGVLRSRGYLDDERLGCRLAARYREEGYGSIAVRQRLQGRGLDADTAAALAAGDGAAGEYARAAAAAFARFPAGERVNAAKVARFLAGRGFDEETTLLVLAKGYGVDDFG